MGRALCKMVDGKICMSTAVLADVLKVDPRTIQEWNERGCPKAARGWWAVTDVLQWRGLISDGGVKTTDEAKKISWAQKKIEAEANLKEQKAEEAEFKNNIMKGEYVKKNEITAELQQFFTVLKRSMLGYSRKIATELSPFVDTITARRIENMITELSVDCLEQISINGIYKPTKKRKK